MPGISTALVTVRQVFGRCKLLYNFIQLVVCQVLRTAALLIVCPIFRTEATTRLACTVFLVLHNNLLMPNMARNYGLSEQSLPRRVQEPILCKGGKFLVIFFANKTVIWVVVDYHCTRGFATSNEASYPSICRVVISLYHTPSGAELHAMMKSILCSCASHVSFMYKPCFLSVCSVMHRSSGKWTQLDVPDQTVGITGVEVQLSCVMGCSTKPTVELQMVKMEITSGPRD